jgi:hypothetical protein
MAPVSMSPTAEAAGERTGFLDTLSVNDFANQFAGPFRARRIAARNGANCRHGSPASRFRIVVRMAVRALGEPIGGDTIKQRG